MARATDVPSWADYHSRRLWLWTALVLGLVAALAVAFAWAIEHHGRLGLLWPLAAWAVVVAHAVRRLQDFRCPRCQRHFFRRNPPLLALRARRCVNCSLPKE
ncbi:MAG: hypothetical protein EOP93_11525 [Lysobacteraceae bacterium]|nr:MAG: hypothetical protein EOP93_11525 [Xanthomonadaceae bacterium]